MNIWTRIGLIVLRVVIGWHFLFEGVEKLESTWNHQGPLLFPEPESFVLSQVFGESKEFADSKAAWSAAGYLREAQGPLAGWFREQAGDLDTQALAVLQMPAEGSPDSLPAALKEQWQDKVQRFEIEHDVGNGKTLQPEFLGVLALAPSAPFPATLPWPALERGSQAKSVEELQKTLIDEDFQVARGRTHQWLLTGTREVPSKLPGVSEKVKESTPQRIADYKKKLVELNEIENGGMPAFNEDVWKDNYRALKKEIQTARTELLRDLDKPFNDTLSVAKFRLNKTQRESKSAAPAPVTQLDWVNFITRWGVTLVGVGLLLGLFTRISCLGGAAFLLMFYLAMPALPWLPANPRAEGHYLFINKNIIEMVALLTLATTQSGKWFGLDGLVQFLNPFGWRRKAPPPPPAPTRKVARPQPVG